LADFIKSYELLIYYQNPYVFLTIVAISLFFTFFKALATTYSLTSLALLIFAPFGIAQTSLALLSFVAKI
jgi:hypothetical protein